MHGRRSVSGMSFRPLLLLHFTELISYRIKWNIKGGRYVVLLSLFTENSNNSFWIALVNLRSFASALLLQYSSAFSVKVLTFNLINIK